MRFSDLTETEHAHLSSAPRTAVSIVMGIDYKKLRRSWARHEGDRDAVIAFSSVQLAEWVVVVEGLRPASEDEASPRREEAMWEFVYDASSSELAPRLQLARILDTVATTFPKDEVAVEATQIRTRTFPVLEIPARVAKVSDDDTGPPTGL